MAPMYIETACTWPIDLILTGTPTPAQSERKSNAWGVLVV